MHCKNVAYLAIGLAIGGAIATVATTFAFAKISSEQAACAIKRITHKCDYYHLKL